MGIVSATKEYERWLGDRLVLDQRELDDKHEEMASDPFSFLRATFYRWVQVWKDKCSDLDSAPEALAVGDLHVQNFGSWRDREGRLVWGINDFDEAHPMAYTQD